MKSMQIIEWGAPLQMRERATPTPQGSEILVAIEACGVCHSDLHIHQGFFDLGNGNKFPISARGVHPPFTMGHEPVGRVVATGPKASPDVVGKSFVIYPWINCGRCDPCHNGLEQICDAPSVIGTRVDGAYSDYVIVPDEKFLVDYGLIDPHLACTLACSGLTVYSALKKIEPASLSAQDSLLIIGAGGLGLSALMIAKSLTKARIIVADIDQAKLDAAQNLGADAVFVSTCEDAAGQIQAFASTENGSSKGLGRGLAATLDFVGLPQTMSLGLGSLRKGGVHVHVGLFGGAYPLSLPPLSFMMLQIKGSYVGTLAEFRELVGLVKNGLKLPLPIDVRRLCDANEALSDLQDGKVIGRVVLRP